MTDEDERRRKRRVDAGADDALALLRAMNERIRRGEAALLHHGHRQAVHGEAVPFARVFVPSVMAGTIEFVGVESEEGEPQRACRARWGFCAISREGVVVATTEREVVLPSVVFDGYAPGFGPDAVSVVINSGMVELRADLTRRQPESRSSRTRVDLSFHWSIWLTEPGIVEVVR